jgi:hypothetical protein
MSWQVDCAPFAGIAEKLKRADQNIINLHSEIVAFFDESLYPVLPDPNDKGWQKAVDYHRNLKIPPRFGVLTGEIVHHLRSCLDHIVWHFSSAAARRDHENILEFPIYRKPLTKKEQPRYDGKVQGITNLRVLALIKESQPYQRGAGATDHPLCIVHDMDRFDKHRELVIVTACANLTFPGFGPEHLREIVAYRYGKPLSSDDVAEAQRAIKHKANVRPQVAFYQFGEGDTKFVVPFLKQLTNAVSDVIGDFAREV